MKINRHIIWALCAVLAISSSSCVGDLDVEPNDPNTKLTLNTKTEWDGYFARLYWIL